MTPKERQTIVDILVKIYQERMGHAVDGAILVNDISCITPDVERKFTQWGYHMLNVMDKRVIIYWE